MRASAGGCRPSVRQGSEGDDRGRDYAESLTSKLTKSSIMCLDLSKFSGVPEGGDAPFLDDLTEECKAIAPTGPMIPNCQSKEVVSNFGVCV